MKTIWIFTLSIQDEQMVPMPENSAILSAQVQGTIICLWALVQPDNITVNHKIRIVGTGHALPDDYNIKDAAFIGTVQTHEGSLVLHVFDEGVE